MTVSRSIHIAANGIILFFFTSEYQDLPCCPGSARITPPNKKERTFLTSKGWKDIGAVTALHSAQATDGLQFPASLAVTRALGIGQK